MTPRQTHRRIKTLLRRARELEDLMLDVRVRIEQTHDNSTDLPRLARLIHQMTMVTRDMSADLLVKSGDILLKDVPK